MPNATPHTPYGMTEGLLMTDITLEGIRAAAEDAAALPEGEHAGGVCVGRPAGSVRVRIARSRRATGCPWASRASGRASRVRSFCRLPT